MVCIGEDHRGKCQSTDIVAFTFMGDKALPLCRVHGATGWSKCELEDRLRWIEEAEAEADTTTTKA
jgi:hypothetical protein